jgi:uncharacterized protein
MKQEKVIVYGASPKPERYANKAIHTLQDHGHTVYPVNPAYQNIDDIQCYKKAAEVEQDIDTITLYLGPNRSIDVVDDIISKKPNRVIMNPGTESDEVKAKLEQAGIQVIEACTLVMLNTNQY